MMREKSREKREKEKWREGRREKKLRNVKNK